MLWAKVCVRAHSDKKIRKAGKFAWQAYEALVRIAKERGQGGLVPFDQCDGDELAFWTNLQGFESELEAAIQGLCATGALEVEDDGLRISAWAKHNPDKTNAERQRRYRKRQKEDAPDPVTDVTVTPVTPVTRDDVTLEKSRVEESREEETNAPAREASRPVASDASLALDHFNEQSGSRLKSKAYLKAANARLKEGATLADLKLVTCWALQAAESKYLRDGNYANPDTLWRPGKFPKYLAAATAWKGSRVGRPHPKPASWQDQVIVRAPTGEELFQRSDGTWTTRMGVVWQKEGEAWVKA